MFGWLKRQIQPPAPEPKAAEPPPRVYFTESARRKAREVLATQGLEEHGAVRLWVADASREPTEYGLGLEDARQRQPRDAVLDMGGFVVLVASESRAQVQGVTVDFVDDPLRPGFRIDPPGRVELPMLA